MTLSRRCLASLILLLLPLPVLGQGGVGFSIGSRSYRSGAILADGSSTLRPARAVEYMAHLHLVRSKRASLGLLLGGFTADLYTANPALSIGLKNAIAGYGGRLAAEVPLRTLSRGGALGIRVEGGLESFVLKDEESQLRGVLSAGPTLQLPLVARWDLNLSALGGALLSSPLTADGLPEGTTNGNPWWITWRIGVIRRLGAR